LNFDLIVRNARLIGADESAPLVDLAIRDGRFAAIGSAQQWQAAEVVDVQGKLVSPGFVETHIHLDKSCVIGRCACQGRRFPHDAMERVSDVKHTFTVDDVHSRARRTLERCISHGTTLMRTHVEVDPKVGLRGLEGVHQLIDEYRWAIDMEICVMPQEGLTNNPGTDELMVEALKSGMATVVGAAPNCDTDPNTQIRRVFEMAREFDVDIDMHLDSGSDGSRLDTLLVCDLTEQYGWGGRVTIGHVSRLSTMPLPDVERVARRMADVGVALTVLPSTDLFLSGRDQESNVRRGVVDANRLLQYGINCSISSNNIKNPFTPWGDGQLIRQANLYANIVQRGDSQELADVWGMFTERSARIMRREAGYGIAEGNLADFVVVEAPDNVEALRDIALTAMGYKAGRRTFTRQPVVLHHPT
jgi:cytosine deaminase